MPIDGGSSVREEKCHAWVGIMVMQKGAMLFWLTEPSAKHKKT